LPYLGDFLGHLLSEITISRTQADAEALRLAELYARDPLLKHFPVPRFRLPTVTVRVPVAVTAMEESPAGQPPRGQLPTTKASDAFWRAFQDQARLAQLALAQPLRDAISKEVDRVVKAADPTLLSGGVTRLGSQLTDATIRTVRAGMTEGTRPEAERFLALESQLREGIIAELVRLRQPPPRLRVAVTSSELREAGTALVNLELQISEEGVEWTLLNPDDAGSARLITE